MPIAVRSMTLIFPCPSLAVPIRYGGAPYTIAAAPETPGSACRTKVKLAAAGGGGAFVAAAAAAPLLESLSEPTPEPPLHPASAMETSIIPTCRTWFAFKSHHHVCLSGSHYSLRPHRGPNLAN